MHHLCVAWLGRLSDWLGLVSQVIQLASCQLWPAMCYLSQVALKLCAPAFYPTSLLLEIYFQVIDRPMVAEELLAIHGFSHQFQARASEPDHWTAKQKQQIAGNMMDGCVLAAVFTSLIASGSLVESLSRMHSASAADFVMQDSDLIGSIVSADEASGSQGDASEGQEGGEEETADLPDEVLDVSDVGF